MFQSKKKPVAVALVCTFCSGPMEHSRSIPAAVGLEEMHSFRCDCCSWVKTIEMSKVQQLGDQLRI